MQVPEIIVAKDNDTAGQQAREKILDRIPSASFISWPEDNHTAVTNIC